MHSIRLRVNGVAHELAVQPGEFLVDVLRERLELTGTKKGCGAGECGSCTVLLDGEPVDSCLVLAVQADGREITTIEGLSRDGRLHPLQAAFVEHGAVQCGFCTPGMIMAAAGLLRSRPDASAAEVREALSGHICRCTGYAKIVEAVAAVAAGGRGP